jgi:hypothetical protein
MTQDMKVEIKVNLAGDVPRALDTLKVAHGSARSIWFLEDLTPGLSSVHPLLDAHLALRLRRDADGSGDSTVKLRPCRRSQLTKRWSREDKERGEWEYKIEGDWAGPRQALAASLSSTLAPDALSAAVETGGDPSAAFTQKQLDFLSDTATIRVNLGALALLGPIAATRWQALNLDGFEVNAERWQVGTLDFLELSIRVDPRKGDPVKEQSAFEAAVTAHHLEIDANTDSKTKRVLEHLAAGGEH